MLMYAKPFNKHLLSLSLLPKTGVDNEVAPCSSSLMMKTESVI